MLPQLKSFNVAEMMSKSQPDLSKLSPQTRLVKAGNDFAEHGFVNPAVYHGSTLLLPDIESFRNQPMAYGRRGSPTSRALEAAIANLEGAHNARVTPSGLSAISTALLSYLSAGDHLLITDAVYSPARHFCNTVLKRLGIETTYYDPLLGGAIGSLIQSNTKLIYCESPGSETMEVQDIPAIVEVAHSKSCNVLVDNSWSGGHYFKPLQHGADISLQSASKYIGGHSDLLMGSIACTKESWPELSETYGSIGMFTGPDDMMLALRGYRTLDVRLERHMRSAAAVAAWLRSRPEVARIMYPALEGCAGHDLWKRDFTGASGLFSLELKPCADSAVAAMIDQLQLFGIGFGWGGFESLCIPFRAKRVASQWAPIGPCLRLHIGLESPDDLTADLDAGFAALRRNA